MVVISKKKYAVGDLIGTEFPLAHALAIGSKSKFCDGCGSSSKKIKLKKCSSCKHMYYCSQECQKTDWVSGHKYECIVYKQYYSTKLCISTDRQLLRLYLVLKNNKKLASQKVDFQCDDKTVKKAFEDLVTPTEKGIQNYLNFNRYLRILNECNIECDESTLFDIHSKCSYSSTEISFSTHCDGIALFLCHSSFSHSCSPNTTKIVKSLRLEVRATKEISVGDEIFAHFVELHQDKKSRQKKLKESFSIDCHCQRCSSDFDKEIDYELMKNLQTEMNLSQSLSPPQLMMAIQRGKELLPFYKQIYGYDVFVTEHLANLVDWHRKLKIDPMDYLNIINETTEYLQITFGTDNGVYKEFVSIYDTLALLNVLRDFPDDTKLSDIFSSGLI